jgi:hypothetical protein
MSTVSVLDISGKIQTSGQILESFKIIFVGYFTMLCLDCVSSNDTMTDELWIGKDMKRRGHGRTGAIYQLFLARSEEKYEEPKLE